MKKVKLVTALAIGAAALASTLSVLPALAGDGPLPADAQAVRSAVARYHSFQLAERAGYSIENEPCVEVPGLGAMGVHAINHALLEDPGIDPLEPEVLLYAPKENGKLELVGVDYMRIAADQSPAGRFDESDKPSLFGRPFDGIMPGHAPWMGWHYDLHVWVAEQNPVGLFAPFNPAVSC